MAMKKIKVYTKTGDDGTTGLLSGQRVNKHHVRIKAYGTIDELNAWLGLIRDADLLEEDEKFLQRLQKKLMTLGAQLSIDESSGKSPKFIQNITILDVTNIEKEIDRITNLLEPLSHFVIPGGHVVVSYAHLARCVCRRAERFITELNETQPIAPPIIAFVNRLSDYLFMLSRKLAVDFKADEVKWIPSDE